MEYESSQKVNLSLDEAKYLKQQLVRAATAKLNLYLPTTDSADPLKSKVGVLVNDFIYDILESARYSIDIDEVNDSSVTLRKLLENPTNAVEPFDFSLQEEVRKLYQQVELETTKLTKLRHDGPLDLKKSYEDSYQESLAKIESLEKEIQEQLAKQDAESDRLINDHREAFEKELHSSVNELTKDYETSLKSIQEIKESIPEERNELIKLKQILAFLKNEESVQ